MLVGIPLAALLSVAVAVRAGWRRRGAVVMTVVNAVLTVLTVLAAVAATVWVMVVGHSGAAAVWQGVVDATS